MDNKKLKCRLKCILQYIKKIKKPTNNNIQP